MVIDVSNLFFFFYNAVMYCLIPLPTLPQGEGFIILKLKSLLGGDLEGSLLILHHAAQTFLHANIPVVLLSRNLSPANSKTIPAAYSIF